MFESQVVYFLELLHISARCGQNWLKLYELERGGKDESEGGAAAPTKKLRLMGQNCDD